MITADEAREIVSRKEYASILWAMIRNKIIENIWSGLYFANFSFNPPGNEEELKTMRRIMDETIIPRLINLGYEVKFNDKDGVGHESFLEVNWEKKGEG